MTDLVQLWPFTMVTHNNVRLPRIVHHAFHVLLGLPVGLIALWAHLPLLWPLAAGVVLAILDKCVWIDTIRRRLVWTGYLAPTWTDGAADLGFTLLGAILPPWPLALLWYYICSIFSDP